jgi:hypothetical protein
MVFPEAEVEEGQAEPEKGDGLEALLVLELRERGRVLGVIPAVCRDRALRRAEPWMERRH